ncbi:hypothetical protein Pst134EA_007457 [Puccinia striiformis f. sp. tritici]|uniref:hypothetical protein n=1 Tax=Puccinia striiformis f. sp. tritici TaxID=168172 RepID=UPI0020083B38|nr:hypothetical protein Pst134EA_007457 [Puccinia striiformis f. sp. tritici]KAH9470192.1 hypothetical protein Pst134EA_007457 [Puccinia striiformis f. sp. tritici]KAI9626994.1 hypothetical protein KEM48_010038 [Puccinia striiformis f. sp. tritici PST-130]
MSDSGDTNMDANPPMETSASEPLRLVEAPRSLSWECWGMLRLEDNISAHSLGLVLSTEEIETQKALLAQVQTQLLPSLDTQLADLLESLDLSASATHPNPDFHDALGITSGIHSTFQMLRSCMTYLAPPHIYDYIVPLNDDEDRGAVKTFRNQNILVDFWDVTTPLRQLLQEYDQLIHLEYHLGGNQGEDFEDNDEADEETALLKHRSEIIRLTANVRRGIKDLIRWSYRSDFQLIQDGMELYKGWLNNDLAKIHEKIIAIEGRNLNVPQNEIKLHQDHLKLMRSIIPLIKLLRLFFNKITGTPRSKPEFILGNVNSKEYFILENTGRELEESIRQLMSFCAALPEAGREIHKKTDEIEKEIRNLGEAISRILISVSFLILPLRSGPEQPSAGSSIFKTNFQELKYALFDAKGELRDALFAYSWSYARVFLPNNP